MKLKIKIKILRLLLNEILVFIFQIQCVYEFYKFINI